LDLGVDTLREGVRDVTLTFGWVFDADAGVLYIPSWWRFNRPENVNVLKGNLKDISEIPSCALLDAFATNLEYLPADLHETFIETLRRRMPKRPPTQDQEQEEQETRTGTGARAARGKNGASRLSSLSEKENAQETAPTTSNAPLLTIARETLELVHPTRPLDELVDAFRGLAAQRRSIDNGVSRDDVVQALNIVMTERRVS